MTTKQCNVEDKVDLGSIQVMRRPTESHDPPWWF